MAIEETARGILSIDLGALVRNYRRLRREAAGSEIAAVVKANAYGLGARQVAPSLADAGCRSFFVAHLEEGVALRELLPHAAIYVLHGLAAGTERDIADARLIPVLNQPCELHRYVALAQTYGMFLPAALQIDTGMCRLGLAPAELAALDQDALAMIDLRLIMSHLAAAEEPENPLNALQRTRFEQRAAGLPNAALSLANSSGIFLGAGFHYQLCRPGVALYGVNPTPGSTNPMEPVVRLSAPILQVHEIDRPSTVGYGAAYEVPAGGRIATIPVGYADGYLRAGSPGATARVAGHIVPIAGRVSMDLITLDISSLPPDCVQPGCMVDLVWGADGVDRLALAAGTIGYEVLTRLGTRFARRYTHSEP
jgi:alanine racemase